MNGDESDIYLSGGSQEQNRALMDPPWVLSCPSPNTWQLIGLTINGPTMVTSRPLFNDHPVGELTCIVLLQTVRELGLRKM